MTTIWNTHRGVHPMIHNLLQTDELGWLVIMFSSAIFHSSASFKQCYRTRRTQCGVRTVCQSILMCGSGKETYVCKQPLLPCCRNSCLPAVWLFRYTRALSCFVWSSDFIFLYHFSHCRSQATKITVDRWKQRYRGHCYSILSYRSLPACLSATWLPLGLVPLA